MKSAKVSHDELKKKKYPLIHTSQMKLRLTLALSLTDTDHPKLIQIPQVKMNIVYS